MEYFNFAKYYDTFTENIDYKARCKYFDKTIKQYSDLEINKVVDLACGTGKLSVEMADLGYKIIGVDNSQQMLEYASGKIYDKDITLLLQSMEELELTDKVDVVICALDSINHLEGITALSKTVNQVSSVLNEGGLFIFDVNTLYKHKYLLADNCYVYETEEVFCCWQNNYNPDDYSVDISLDFFVQAEDENYIREFEDFSEHFFSGPQIIKELEQAGLELIGMFGEDSFEKPNKNEQRIVYVAKQTK